MAIESRNPATGEPLASYAPLDAAGDRGSARAGGRGISAWRRTTFAERARLLNAAADLLEADRERLGAPDDARDGQARCARAATKC